MTKPVRRAGVIGAGVMGSGIMAHFANAGVDVVMLDIVPPELTKEDRDRGLSEESEAFKNKIGAAGVKRALPPARGNPSPKTMG